MNDLLTKRDIERVSRGLKRWIALAAGLVGLLAILLHDLQDWTTHL